MEWFVCFSLSFVWNFVKNIARKLANRISYQTQEFSIGGFKFAKGLHVCQQFWTRGSIYMLADLDQGVQICCDTGQETNSKKHALCAAKDWGLLEGGAGEKKISVTVLVTVFTCIWKKLPMKTHIWHKLGSIWKMLLNKFKMS